MKNFRCKGHIGVVWALLMVNALGGCAQYLPVEKGERIQVGNAFAVATSINWSKQETGNIEGWTVDGPQLQRLVFLKGIPDGKPLIGFTEGEGECALCFHSSMTSVEIMELFLANLTRTGAHGLKAYDLRPSSFGAIEGFRFEFQYATRQGLKYKGLIAGAQKDQKLFAFMYVGTALYHFDKHRLEIERMLASLTLL
jgi:hypothetical protein